MLVHVQCIAHNSYHADYHQYLNIKVLLTHTIDCIVGPHETSVVVLQRLVPLLLPGSDAACNAADDQYYQNQEKQKCSNSDSNNESQIVVTITTAITTITIISPCEKYLHCY